MAGQESSSARRRAVVVNDDPAILDLYRDVLHELDYESVTLSTTGIESEQIRAHEPDAVILDLQVGAEGEYGIAMAIQLRNDARLANIPIMVCTADVNALDGVRKQLQDIGVPALLKPVSIETIEEVLSTPVGYESGPLGREQ